MEVINMAKCEKCGKEYQDGLKHVCSAQEEQKPETAKFQEEATPVGQTQPQNTENQTK